MKEFRFFCFQDRAGTHFGSGVRNGCRLIIIVVALLVSGIFVRQAGAQPPVPPVFYGTVQLDGAGVPDGMIVSTWIGTQKYAQTQTETYQGQAVYAITVPGDDPGTPDVVEGGTADDEVSFKIGAQVAIVTGTWQESSIINLDLVACTLPGDMDCNCVVDIVDIMKMVACLDGSYHRVCDLDNSGDNDVTDVQTVADQWRQTCS